jgi:hypothetical protein
MTERHTSEQPEDPGDRQTQAPKTQSLQSILSQQI